MSRCATICVPPTTTSFTHCAVGRSPLATKACTNASTVPASMASLHARAFAAARGMTCRVTTHRWPCDTMDTTLCSASSAHSTKLRWLWLNRPLLVDTTAVSRRSTNGRAPAGAIPWKSHNASWTF